MSANNLLFSHVSRLQFLLDFLLEGCLLGRVCSCLMCKRSTWIDNCIARRKTQGWVLLPCSLLSEWTHVRANLKKKIAKMFSWRVSRAGVAPVFNINQLVNGSFVYAGAFIRHLLFYASGKSNFFFLFLFCL